MNKYALLENKVLIKILEPEKFNSNIGFLTSQEDPTHFKYKILLNKSYYNFKVGNEYNFEYITFGMRGNRYPVRTATRELIYSDELFEMETDEEAILYVECK